jgi:TonB family protein
MAVQTAVGSKVLDGGGQQGAVVIAFSLSAQGELIGVRVTQSSGYQRLDQQAVARVLAASFPTPPGGGMRLSHVSKFTFR